MRYPQIAAFRIGTKLLAGASLLLSVCCFTPQANATSIYTLPPGMSMLAGSSPFPTGGTVLDTLVTPFSGSSPFGTLNGTVTSTVYSGDPSNPYGGYTFTYLLTLNGSSTDSSSELNVNGFGNFFTDISYSGSGTAPSNFSRSGGNGNLVRFLWLNGGGLQPGNSSALVVVQTDAHVFGDSIGGINDSQPIASISVLAPVPEPSVASLFVIGLATFFIYRRRNLKQQKVAA